MKNSKRMDLKALKIYIKTEFSDISLDLEVHFASVLRQRVHSQDSPSSGIIKKRIIFIKLL